MRFLVALTLFVVAVACTEPLAPGTDQIRLADFTTLPKGKLLGLAHWPEARWGTAPLTLNVETMTTDEIAPGLRLAKARNQPLFIGPRRAMVTNTGNAKGSFSLTRAKASVDAWARGPLKPDSVRKYAPWIKGWYLIDEPFCGPCWGGREARYSDLVEYARYFRQRIDPDGLVPLAIRVPPTKLAAYGDWGGLIDAGWVVFKPTTRFSVEETLDREAAVARRYGWKLVAGVNAENCDGQDRGPCSPTELRRYLEPIIRHPAVCASSSWRYDADTWRQSGIRSAWDYLANIAKTQPNTDCR